LRRSSDCRLGHEWATKRWRYRIQLRFSPATSGPGRDTAGRNWNRCVSVGAAGGIMWIDRNTTWPLSSANRTPRSSNSSGYFLGLDMTTEHLLPRTAS
jgi:hypothetical protein